MKVYIVTDLEGVSGVVNTSATVPDGSEYAQARKMLTREVNACCRGAFAGGASEVTVLNGHGANRAYDIDFDLLETDAEHIVGSPWDKYLPDLDKSFGMLFQLGAHSRSGSASAVLEHTMSSASWIACRVNGREVGEQGIIGYVAGHYGVGVGLVTGDRAACDEASELFPGVVTVETKRGLGRLAAVVETGQPVLARIEAAAAEAVAKGRTPPLVCGNPCEIEVDYARTSHTDSAKLRCGVKRTGPRTICYSGPDILAAISLMY